MTSPPPLLSVEHLSVTYRIRGRLVQAVKDLSFDVSYDEILGIVGESGSGKSSIAYAILNLFPPNTSTVGEIRFLGENILGVPYSRLRAIYGNGISLIFQDPTSALNPTMRAGDQILEAISAHRKTFANKAKEEEVLPLLRSVGLPPRVFDAYPHELSGGTRQRVVICIAMANNPKLIIADEPTTNVDVVSQAQILELFTRLGRSANSGSILITHDLAVAAQACDRILVLHDGAVQECSPTVDLFRDPKSEYTRTLLENVIRVDRRPDHDHPGHGKKEGV